MATANSEAASWQARAVPNRPGGAQMPDAGKVAAAGGTVSYSAGRPQRAAPAPGESTGAAGLPRSPQKPPLRRANCAGNRNPNSFGEAPAFTSARPAADCIGNVVTSLPDEGNDRIKRFKKIADEAWRISAASTARWRRAVNVARISRRNAPMELSEGLLRPS